MSVRHALIVLAHPDPQSFNAALAHAAARALTDLGARVSWSDLYAMGFGAVAGRGDILDAPAEGPFNLAREQGRAHAAGTLAPDIRAEQAKLAEADFVLFQFPLWWFGMPAILKGWVDRVLTLGFAYGLGRWWNEGPMRDKRAMLSITTGSPAGAYAPDGRNGDIERILWPIEAGVLALCGFTVLPAVVAYGAPWMTDEERRDHIDRLCQRLRALEATPARFFHPLSDFGDDMRLKPDVVPRTPGQHRP
ncbi:MAG: NAD(P)H-dependent oxidoreductase [Sphingomonadaceae bacterium]|uniref:NAD(P)H-dependent oxidoreductase n=1 Tax=Thermaurantiacus sp. TaxID=2820283 RepID=UPI00298EFA75|nr:NAD(P)H-dependent oxidoreductase [Thermaurantiacus sp.]MCS6986017.1 NAD(P)H-dependent oxidoreductase [Sphingomonadaceae bacterium]MDW8414767.1 NAD(P)H-dependent oxidoreductase [Thermaurantiacus sp.]